MVSNKVLVAVAAVLAVAVVVMGVVVLRQVVSGSDEAGSGEAAVAASATMASVEPTEDGSDSYVLADGTCPTAEGVDYSDPAAVAERFTAISYCFDSMVDSTMTAGMIRAEDLMTEEMFSKLVVPERNGLQSQWVLAQEHEAYTRPRVSEAPTEPMVDASGQWRYESKMVEWLWVGRDGASMDGGYATLQIGLVEEDGRWLVSEVETGVFEAN